MKTIKKLILWTLAGIFLGPFACLQISNTAECAPGGELDVVVDFGVQRWSDDQAYCTFPELTVTEKLPNSIKTIQISYSGEDTTNAEITLPAMAGFTASEDNTSVFVTCTTTEPAASVQEFLRNVQYKCNYSQSISILLSESEIPSDIHYFPGTGHFYKYVPKAGLSWINAYKEALNSEIGGWQGYLAVITSEEEDDFYKKYSATDGTVPKGWLGGTRFKVSNMGSPSATVSSDNMGYYYWACGPESCFKPSDPNWTSPGLLSENDIPEGTYGAPSPTNSVFFDKITSTGAASNVHVVYNYAPWHTGNKEPNNANGGAEGCLGTNTADGKFNDFRNVTNELAGYTIEYGDRLWGNSTTLAGSVIVSTNITRQTTLTAPAQNSMFDPGATVTVSGTGAPGHIVTIVEGGKILATTEVNPDGYWSVQLSGLPGGTHDVLITQFNSYGNAFPAVPLSFKILKTPTETDFDCILPVSLEFDGTEKQAIIRTKDGITGMGEVTIMYIPINPDGTEGTPSTTPPTNAGRVRVRYDVAKGTDYSAAKGLRAKFFPIN